MVYPCLSHYNPNGVTKCCRISQPSIDPQSKTWGNQGSTSRGCSSSSSALAEHWGPPNNQLGNPWNTSKSIGFKSFKAHFPNNQLPFHGQKKTHFQRTPIWIGNMIVLEVLGLPYFQTQIIQHFAKEHLQKRIAELEKLLREHLVQLSTLPAQEMQALELRRVDENWWNIMAWPCKIPSGNLT